MSDEDLKVFEDEKDILLDHDYDGIKELDNPLPRWWTATFVLTIVFAVPYYIAHTFLGAQTIQEELAADMKEIKKLEEAYDSKQGKFSLAMYEEVNADAKAAKIGKKVYKRKCKACHGAKGEGGVGPNLADSYWLHGNGSLESIYNTINKGIEEKGMAAWGKKLSKKKIYTVLKFVNNLKGTTPAEAKAPQGTEY